MKNSMASEIARSGVERQTIKAQGHPPSIIHLGTSVHAHSNLGDQRLLEVASGAPEIQAADGRFLFLLGYSTIGGGDVLG